MTDDETPIIGPDEMPSYAQCCEVGTLADHIELARVLLVVVAEHTDDLAPAWMLADLGDVRDDERLPQTTRDAASDALARLQKLN